MLWEDRTDRHGYDGDTIYFKKSNNYGQTFDDAIVLGSSNSDSISYHLIDMTESNGIVYVFMLQSDPQIDETMAVFKASLDGGNTFGNPQPFLQFEEMTTSIRAISVNGIVYVIDSEVHGYSNESGENSFRKILSDGNISDVVNLSKTGYFVNHLDLAVSDDNVYVISVEITDELDSDGRIHEKRTLHFTKSHDGGNTFDVSKKLNIDSESEGVENQGARVFAYDNFVYVMWEEHYDDDGQDWHRKTWFAKSNDYGKTFDVVAVHPLDTLHSKFGHVYAYEENKTLYFIVTSKINSFDEDSPIYFAKSDDGGLTISKIIDVAGKPLPIMDSPQVTIHDNYVQIVSDVLRKKNCILHISSSDGGESFIQSANLSPNGNLEDCLAK